MMGSRTNRTLSELDNITWHEVQKRIREVQNEQQMCIHKTDLTELDIYHRILSRPVKWMLALLGHLNGVIGTERINCSNFDDHQTSILFTNVSSFTSNDYVACIYDDKWWLGKIKDKDEVNNCVLVHFFHPSGPKTAFQLSKNDTAWVPAKKIVQKCVCICRFKNYMVAMVNKSLLPVHFNIPMVGPVIYFSHGLKFNINFILFWGPWSPFENWNLKDDYKKGNKKHEMANRLSTIITYCSLLNLALLPFILLWQILYSFFNYTETIKREPSFMGSRCWSLYARMYLRHFNELDHELNARLNRAYRPASKYMNIFTSPVMTIIAKNVVFVAGSMLAVLLALTVYDEDVLTVDHVLTAITVLGAIIAGFRVFIPDENLVWCPENLMTAILAQVHYLPDNWRGNAHTSRVRNELSQLFQYKATYLLGELLSPVITPFILFFYLRPKALDIVDFLRHFTVQVQGVGDVCSFAQMDVHRHGNPTWHAKKSLPPCVNQYNQVHGSSSAGRLSKAEDGKTELSLIHFTLTNPDWQPPTEAETFVSKVRSARKEETVTPAMQLIINDNSLSSLGVGTDIHHTEKKFYITLADKNEIVSAY
ncbi:Autophagy- protein 9A [Homalodisca vitripennis]|nr:Autophagy- protein 9A [Homalodisca vitripennis]